MPSAERNRTLVASPDVRATSDLFAYICAYLRAFALKTCFLSRRSRNQQGNASPSAVRANLDDPPIHIRPVCSRISGCEGKNRVGSSHYGTPTIAPRLRDRKGFLRSK